MRAQGPSALARGAGPTKRMAVGSFQPQRSQGRTFGNLLVSPQRNQLCKKCNRLHWGPCMMAIETCYWCGQFGHFNKDCMGKGFTQKPLASARVYALVPEESEVVTSNAPILRFEASILFDLGATHSFVSITFVRLSRFVVRTLELGLAITTLVGKTVACKHVVCECPVGIRGRVLLANLVVLPMFSYDVIF